MQAALYTSKLVKTTQEKTDSNLRKTFLEWQHDGSHWIKNFKKKREIYIGNGIAKITDLTLTNLWNNVNTRNNPADQRTRGLTATQRTEKSLWLYGPQFSLTSSKKLDKRTTATWKCVLEERKTNVSGKTSTANLQGHHYCQQILPLVETQSHHHQNETPLKENKNTGTTSHRRREVFSIYLSKYRLMRMPNDFQATNQFKRVVNRFIWQLKWTKMESFAQTGDKPTVSTATKEPIILECRNRINRLFLELQQNLNGHVGIEKQTQSTPLNYCVLQCKTVKKKISNRCYECRRQNQLISQNQKSNLQSTDFQTNLWRSRKP